MVKQRSRSTLHTLGCVSICLSVIALVYMMFVWSLPVQYHYLYVESGLDLNWTGGLSHATSRQDRGPASKQSTTFELYRNSNISGGEQVKSETSAPRKITPGVSSATTPIRTNGNDASAPERNAPAFVPTVIPSHKTFTTASTHQAPFTFDLAIDFQSRKWSRSQKGKKWKPAKIIKSPTNLPPYLENETRRNETKYLVYLCDLELDCGGLGDRERSLTGVYAWSRIINRKFKLVMGTPCNLSKFYLPNRVDWLHEDGELEPPSRNNTIYIHLRNGKIRFSSKFNKAMLTKLEEGDFNENFPQRCIYMKTNFDICTQFWGNTFYAKRLKEWSGLADTRSRFFWAWHDLMKPSSEFTSRLESILGSEFIRRKSFTTWNGNSRTSYKPMYNVGNASLICAHVRIGKNPSNPRDGAFTAVTGEDIPVLFNFMHKQRDKNGGARFFIATDYIYVRKLAQKFFGSQYIDYGALISHIDTQRSDKDACLGFESALLDQTILSLCDVLITSRSGFSLRAAHMRNSTDPVYVIDGGEVRVLEE